MEPPPSSDPTPHALDYAAKLPFYRRRVFRRLMIVVVLLLAGSWTAWCVPPTWRAARVYYYQRQCVAHPIAPNSIVISSGPPPFAFASPEFAELAQAFANGPQLNANTHPVTVYIGQRRATNGLTRFVAVTATAFVSPGRAADVYFDVYTHATGFAELDASPRVGPFPGGSRRWDSSQLGPLPDVVIYSAVEDGDDDSRFTFTYDVNVWHCLVDCDLLPDGSLHFTRQSFIWYVTPQGSRSQPTRPSGEAPFVLDLFKPK
jgi:hypothetical protein